MIVLIRKNEKYEDGGFYAISRIDAIVQGPFEVDAMVLRLINMFMSWRSASFGVSTLGGKHNGDTQLLRSPPKFFTPGDKYRKPT